MRRLLVHDIEQKGLEGRGYKVAKILVEMEFDFDGFEELTDEEKFSSIEGVLETGADSTYAHLKINSIEIKD